MLRPVGLDDCGPTYLGWLQDPEISQWLETRWTPQTNETMRAFVSEAVADRETLLMAMIRMRDGAHVGNIKLGPINTNHMCADLSYFVGDRGSWGRGLATEAIMMMVGLAFEELGLHRVQAACYAGNGGSARALEKAGFRSEGSWRQRLLGADGNWHDQLWFGIVRA